MRRVTGGGAESTETGGRASVYSGPAQRVLVEYSLHARIDSLGARGASTTHYEVVGDYKHTRTPWLMVTLAATARGVV